MPFQTEHETVDGYTYGLLAYMGGKGLACATAHEEWRKGTAWAKYIMRETR